MKPKILVAVDGSENSMKAVRYVGDMVCRCRETEVTFFHVLAIPPALLEHGGSESPDEEKRIEQSLAEEVKKWEKEQGQRVEAEIFAPARRIFEEKGVQGNVLTVQAKVDADRPMDEAQAIVQEVENGGYNTVVLGRRGRSMLKDCVFGSVTSKVTHAVKDCAVWIVE